MGSLPIMGSQIRAVCTVSCIFGSSGEFEGIPHSGPIWAAWGGSVHSLVMPSARMSDILQQDDKMRILGWSMMSTCPDGCTDGPVDRQEGGRG